ncbi:MAG TPA: caspase family protein [Thioploca sp.]|nr:MAG: hypothetical protein DRR19_08325 [Gammaproteobacteria bacterium]HDN27531.1 caspase family protein [Thioploca sp.]
MHTRNYPCQFARLFLWVLGLTVQADTLATDNRGMGGIASEAPIQSTLPVQHALVVGIDDYQSSQIYDLAGAVNDATLLKKALRQAGVQLPAERILLNAAATRYAFVQAWQNMVEQAKPGDTLILTFSGHGGQEPDRVPVGEKDGRDETLMFHDFSPKLPTVGRISDDELFGLFEKSSDYNILVLIDACHSSGMVRSSSFPVGRFRTTGF